MKSVTYAGYWVRKFIRTAVKAALINYRYLDYQLNGEITPWLTGNTMSEAEFTFENDYYRTNARLPVYDTKTETIVTVSMEETVVHGVRAESISDNMGNTVKTWN